MNDARRKSLSVDLFRGQGYTPGIGEDEFAPANRPLPQDEILESFSPLNSNLPFPPTAWSRGAPQEEEEWMTGMDCRFEGGRQIFAVGDLHGNYEGFRSILLRCGLIDDSDHWVARDTHLIQLGDILGRGGEPGKIFSLLKRLEEEAPFAGSRVHLLLGNHEVLTMRGTLHYNTVEEFLDLSQGDALEVFREESEGDPLDAKYRKRLEILGCREFKETLSPKGRIGQWLLRHPSAVNIGGNLFVHGGLNRNHGLQSLEILNAKVRRELVEAIAGGENILTRDGPQWNREFIFSNTAHKGQELDEVLNYHECRRMVVGHTPTSHINKDYVGEIVTLYQGRLICADTGIGKSYGSRLSALRIIGDEITAIYP
jgi:hypothetical protein